MLASPMPSSPSTSERQRFGMRNMFSFVKAPRVNKRPALSRPASKEYRGPYINSKTPKKDLPQTWEEWNDAYSKGLIEFEDPPLPPAPSSDAPKASFSELGFFIPPPHPNERRRQQSSSAFRLSQCEDLVGSHCYPVPGNNPELIEVHLPLRALTTEAMTRFGTNGVQVSILDEGMLFYLAEVGFGLGVLKRETTLCAHTMLKAQTGDLSPFVVLNIESDWRFSSNNFDVYTRGFYAGVPITLPSVYDSAIEAPIGIFCLIDEAPRASFSDEDRRDLQELARRAGDEIQLWHESKEQKRLAEMSLEKERWDREATGSVSSQGTVATTAPSNAGSANEDALPTTDLSPTLCKTRRRGSASGRSGILMAFARPLVDSLPDKTQSVLNLSTQLIGETLDFDFTYIARVAPYSPTTPSSSPSLGSAFPVSSSPLGLTLISTHNLPSPPPTFSTALHISFLASTSSSLLYHAADPSVHPTDEFVAGLLWRIDDEHVLAGFSCDPRRVFTRSDRAFLGRFARDLEKWTGGTSM